MGKVRPSFQHTAMGSKSPLLAKRGDNIHIFLVDEPLHSISQPIMFHRAHYRTEVLL